jgi:hypothetical protein
VFESQFWRRYCQTFSTGFSSGARELLRKVLPDLQAVTIGGDPANPLRHEHAIDLSSMSDKDLAELVRGGA